MNTMKKGLSVIISVVFFVLLAFPALADANTQLFKSETIETFDGDSGYTWVTDGIKYATKKDYGLFPVYPQALYRPGENTDGKQSFGLNGQFSRQGYNWIDIYPTLKDGDGGATEIPLKGLVKSVDVWVWGSNRAYRLEAYVRDYRGMIHRMDLGSLAFYGWKNLRASMPSNFPMADRALPLKADSSTFVKFRLWTGPNERVNNFYMYLDELTVFTDTFSTRFDGDNLAEESAAQEMWAGVNQQ